MIHSSSFLLVGLSLMAVAPFQGVLSQPSATEQAQCAAANRIWKNFGQTTDIPLDCCRTNRITCDINDLITGLNWGQNGTHILRGTISPEVCNLPILYTLDLRNNQITGRIPSCLGSLTKLRNLWLWNNRLNGIIPTELTNAKNLNQLILFNNQLTGPIPAFTGLKTPELAQIWIENNQLSGSIPASLGTISALFRFTAQNNQLSGAIPSSLGNLRSTSTVLFLFNNSLTGYPTSLSAVPGTKQIFPNPMSTVPYDVAKSVSAGWLVGDALQTFLDVPLTSTKKRQISSSTSKITIQEAVALCPLNNTQGADVAAGCIAGIYQNFCMSPATLDKCQEAYDLAFAASYYSSLGAVCPAWKFGPRSSACASAITKFVFDLKVGDTPDNPPVPIYLRLNSTHATQLVGTIFASQKYAPCIASTCKWA
jgi:hypothetical protein